MKIRPLGDRVLVKRQEGDEKSAGGIVIPDTAKEKPIRGEVVAVGTGKTLENGDTRAIAVKKGDIVLFAQYAGTDVKLDGGEYLVLREDDLMAVVEK